MFKLDPCIYNNNLTAFLETENDMAIFKAFDNLAMDENENEEKVKLKNADFLAKNKNRQRDFVTPKKIDMTNSVEDFSITKAIEEGAITLRTPSDIKCKIF